MTPLCPRWLRCWPLAGPSGSGRWSECGPGRPWGRVEVEEQRRNAHPPSPPRAFLLFSPFLGTTGLCVGKACGLGMAGSGWHQRSAGHYLQVVPVGLTGCRELLGTGEKSGQGRAGDGAGSWRPWDGVDPSSGVVMKNDGCAVSLALSLLSCLRQGCLCCTASTCRHLHLPC